MSRQGKKKPLSKLVKIPKSILERSERQGGRRVVIWISEHDWTRLEVGGSGWYKPVDCSTDPSPRHNVRTLVQERAVEGSTFRPDWDDDLESALEWCEAFDVPDVKAKERDALKARRKALKKGDAFVYCNVGFGYTTYEAASDIERKKNTKLFTQTFSKGGMDWDARRGTWVFDGGTGMLTIIMLREEVPKGESIG